MLALGLFATLAFVGGLATGQVLLLLAIKSKSGPLAISYQSSPLWFFVCMALNLAAAVAIWALFIAWLRERRAQ